MGTVKDPASDNPPSQPRVFIQMSGAPGSGKSTLARLLRQSLGGVVLDHDVLRSSLLEDTNLTFDTIAKQAYNLQWALARDIASQGCNIIIDSPCNFQEGLDQGSAIAEEHGMVYWYVECRVADLDVLDQRMRARTPMRSQRTGVERPPEAARVERQGEDSRALFRRRFEAPCRPSGGNVAEVDSMGDVEGVRDRVLERILGATSGV
ncbi:P-loop containing nucleoside triphosphate hydrolase protein [Dichotomopilus funicola]|uniref:P-loop containing nucleoside triphosphate hydrolase protein n=1 Tax=Dichotomopilus funicola TaxID=1934379 RepID=A0AAN6ZPT7_9PEZI|nr:P-loop containing nucleoside triphosphate hydrolase protein [Dichotomopilus funicola]